VKKNKKFLSIFQNVHKTNTCFKDVTKTVSCYRPELGNLLSTIQTTYNRVLEQMIEETISILATREREEKEKEHEKLRLLEEIGKA
jgi:hypothetical protein